MAIGTVKWFNPALSGFGMRTKIGRKALCTFQPLNAQGLSTLAEGKKVSLRTPAGQNGKSSAENLPIEE